MTPEPELMPAAEDIRGAIEPTGYKILIYIVRPEEIRKGVAKPGERLAAEETASPVAQVISLGPLAYKDEKRFPDGIAWCQPGDFILMRPYSGTRFERENSPFQYRLINDDTVEAVIRCDPQEIQRA
jgi:co-chaperonin GroES (HSP10)